MFQLYRRYLIHKTWKARLITIGDQVSEKRFGILKEIVLSFLASLDVKRLGILAKIVTGARYNRCFYTRSECSKHDPSQPRDILAIDRERYLIAKVWRWTDLTEEEELKHFESGCESRSMGDCLCVNPFHFSRVVKQEIPYKNLQGKTEMSFEDSGLPCTDKDSTRTSDEGILGDPACSRQNNSTWVKLAYWEGNNRVGPMYHGHERTINICERIPEGNHQAGFCLNELERTREMNEPTKMVFSNIGDGVQLSLDKGNIYIHNRGNAPIFINGELLQLLHSTRTPIVQKLASGNGLKIFDCTLSRNLGSRRHEPHSLRFSFVKGFGRGYKRQYITNCPCWVEMFFFLSQEEDL